MAVIVYHLRYDLSASDRLSVAMPMEGESLVEATRNLLKRGGYRRAAVVDTDDLDKAFVLTQNGVGGIESWSLEPPPGVVPADPHMSRMATISSATNPLRWVT